MSDEKEINVFIIDDEEKNLVKHSGIMKQFEGAKVNITTFPSVHDVIKHIAGEVVEASGLPERWEVTSENIKKIREGLTKFKNLPHFFLTDYMTYDDDFMIPKDIQPTGGTLARLMKDTGIGVLIVSGLDNSIIMGELKEAAFNKGIKVIGKDKKAQMLEKYLGDTIFDQEEVKTEMKNAEKEFSGLVLAKVKETMKGALLEAERLGTPSPQIMHIKNLNLSPAAIDGTIPRG